MSLREETSSLRELASLALSLALSLASTLTLEPLRMWQAYL